MSTPADRCRMACPEEWCVDQIIVYIVEPSESDAHDPTPPYHYGADDGTPWYDTPLGNIFCWAMLILFCVVLPWALVSWRLEVAT